MTHVDHGRPEEGRDTKRAKTERLITSIRNHQPQPHPSAARKASLGSLALHNSLQGAKLFIDEGSRECSINIMGKKVRFRKSSDLTVPRATKRS